MSSWAPQKHRGCVTIPRSTVAGSPSHAVHSADVPAELCTRCASSQWSLQISRLCLISCLLHFLKQDAFLICKQSKFPAVPHSWPSPDSGARSALVVALPYLPSAAQTDPAWSSLGALQYQHQCLQRLKITL